MSWTFEIRFSGLTTFVLSPPDNYGARGCARVILMNAKYEMYKHEPVLWYEAKNVNSPWGIPAPRETELEAKSDKKTWRLMNVDLHFLPAPGVTITDPFNVVDPDETGGPESEKFFWVPNLKNLHLDACCIKRGCLASSPPPDLVAVRLPLRHGKVQTTKLAFENESYGDAINFKFAPLNDPNHPIEHQQYCGIEVSCQFTVPRGVLTLVAVPFNGKPASCIAFEPDSGEIVTVHLENRPADEISNDDRQGCDDGRDQDFSLYYKLSEESVPSGDEIVPVLPQGASFPPGNCIIGRFDDHKEA